MTNNNDFSFAPVATAAASGISAHPTCSNALVEDIFGAEAVADSK